jgi:hypothetical protein
MVTTSSFGHSPKAIVLRHGIELREKGALRAWIPMPQYTPRLFKVFTLRLLPWNDPYYTFGLLILKMRYNFGTDSSFTLRSPTDGSYVIWAVYL